MSGKGNCYDNTAVEALFDIITAELIWRRPSENRQQTRMAIFQDVTCLHTYVGIQHWKTKARWPSNAKGPERAPGAAQIRDRSTAPFELPRNRAARKAVRGTRIHACFRVITSVPVASSILRRVPSGPEPPAL